MKDLIERLDKATVSDRALEAAIARAVGDEMPSDPVGWPPRYMESIDAALTLVPEGWTWSADASVPGWNVQFTLHGAEFAQKTQGRHTRPAIALCIAALKARAP